MGALLRKNRWLRAVLLLAVVYVAIGMAFGTLAGAADSPRLRVAWRLTAWGASAVAFLGHIGYEHLRLRAAPRTTAWHAALSVALGALGLALAANVHARVAAVGNRRALALAIVIWPLLCGVPAFLVAHFAAAGLRLVRPTP